MTDNREITPFTPEKKAEYLILRGGYLGFHYTEDSALPDAFKHGLLSRWEEQKRGLKVRKRASRSLPNAVYFTTRMNDLYFSSEGKPSLDEALKDVVGITIDRPDYARKEEGHFAEDDFVAQERFKCLVFVDRITVEKPSREKIDTYDVYEFGEPLPEDYIRARVESLRKICQDAEVDIPIYGVSGDMYYPERKTRSEIWEMRLNKLRQERQAKINS